MNQEYEQAMDHFIQYVRIHYPDSSTAFHYESDLKQFGSVINRAPRDIGHTDINEFVTMQLTKNLSATTVNRRLASLSRFFEYLADEAGDDYWSNPVMAHHRVRTGNHLPRDLSEAVARQFWQAVEQGPVRDQAIVALMLDVGLRVSEVADLTLSSFERSIKPGQLTALRVRGKGNKERRVWLTVETASLLETWLDERPAVEDNALFITRRRRGFSRRGIQERVKHYTHLAGLASEAVSCHRLRHTFARRMAEARMPLPSLSHWLGHSQLTTTQVYIDGANPEVRADYQRAMSVLADTQAARADSMATSDDPAMTTATSASPRTAVPDCVRKAPSLNAAEIGDKVAHLPLWLVTELCAFLGAKQVRWQAQYRRRRAQQWLSELRRAWEWLLAQRQMEGLASLSRVDLRTYLTHLQAADLSSHTVNHFLTTFWGFLKFAEERGATVVPGVYRLPRPKRADWQPRPLTESEYQCLQQAVSAMTTTMMPAVAACHRCWFFILADGGLRVGELMTLTVSDWQPDTATLTVRYGKGCRQRHVPLTGRAAQAINDHLATRQDVSLVAHEPLVAYAGKAVLPNYIRSQLHIFAQQAQLAGITPHRLRHTYATRLLNSGQMPITTLQKLMGHRHINMTMRYVKLYDKTIRHDYEAAMTILLTQETGYPTESVWEPAIDSIFNVQEAEQVPVFTNEPAPVVNCM